MRRFDVGILTHEELKGLSNSQTVVNALVLINNNLCELIDVVRQLKVTKTAGEKHDG